MLVCSPFQEKANQDGLVLSTLPPSAQSRRQAAPAEQQNDPQPIGVIRLVGASSAKVDVKIGIHNGRPLATWPKAKTKTDRVLWDNLRLSADLPTTDTMEGAGHPEKVDEANWLSALRREPSAYLANDGGMDRFLAYDVELDYASPLRLKGGKDFAYEVTNGSSLPLRELTLYKPDGSHWRSASLVALLQAPLPSTNPTSAPATLSASNPTTAAASQPLMNASDQQDSPIMRMNAQPATTEITHAAASAVAGPFNLTLRPSPATQPSELMAPWKETLVREGISATDAEVILRILETNAMDPKRLTAVYELDPSEMDRLLPLEVIPEPRKTVRVGLVILKDADPGVASEIDELVLQLGDDDWARRDAASNALSKLGKAAKPQLEKAVNNKDLEVVWRAERLLAAISPDAAKSN